METPSIGEISVVCYSSMQLGTATVQILIEQGLSFRPRGQLGRVVMSLSIKE